MAAAAFSGRRREYASSRSTNKLAHRFNLKSQSTYRSVMDSSHTTAAIRQEREKEKEKEKEKERAAAAKSAILAIVEFNKIQGVSTNKTLLFQHYGIQKRTGWRILDSRQIHRVQDDPDRVETRGRKPCMTKEQIIEMDAILEREGWEGRSMTWTELGQAVNVECSPRTLKRQMESFQYHKCMVCLRGWASKSTAEKRFQYANTMLHSHPSPETWHQFRFSGEICFGFAPQGKTRIIRKPGQRCCPDCSPDHRLPNQKDEKRLYAWAAIGLNFKSELIFYESPSTSAGKLTQEEYIDKILRPVVRKWLENGEQFVLVEDGDSSHGPSRKTVAKDWKERNNIRYIFNCANSPDLSPIENAWPLPKPTKSPDWDFDTMKEAVLEGWRELSVDTINGWVNSMPDRMRAVAYSGGRMTGY